MSDAVSDALLRARVRVRRGDLALDLPLEVRAGEVVALLGPNGAGKTTALRALAGLLGGPCGEVVLDGEVLDGVALDGGAPDAARPVPPERRRVGLVPQDHLLFPHLSALENVAFGLRARGTARAAARVRARQELDRVGLREVEGARPAALSGGQAQRVALARALATDPRLLLLDEPLAALDAGARAAVRSDLARRLAGLRCATVVVTHDPVDAVVLADRVVVLEGGRVVQEGPPSDVARHPRTDYVASLVGLVLHRGTARRDGGGAVVDLAPGGRLVTGSAVAGDVLVAVSPSSVVLHPHRPDGSARNAWPCVVVDLERRGDRVRVQLDGAPPVLADVTAASVAELRLAPGAEVWAAVKAGEVVAYAR